MGSSGCVVLLNRSARRALRPADLARSHVPSILSTGERTERRQYASDRVLNSLMEPAHVTGASLRVERCPYHAAHRINWVHLLSDFEYRKRSRRAAEKT